MSLKIVASSHAFAPMRGGLETASRLLAEEFARRGHEVTVVTQTPAGAEREAFPYAVVRRPSVGALWRLLSDADVVWHNHISLRTGWPHLLGLRKPWVVTHQTWIPRGSLASAVKFRALARARSVAISGPVAASLPVPSEIIPNPYDDRVFFPDPAVVRDGEIAAVGRLVSDKGFDLLLRALGLLRRAGRVVGLTLAGSGPEEEALRVLAREEGIEGQVVFAGAQAPEGLAALLRRHRVLAVPSRWAEPFGIVALEGIACGCVVVASNGGGLPEAVGPCGLLFPNGDVPGLAAALGTALDSRADAAVWEAHAARFTRERIGGAYLGLFEKVLAETSGRRR